MRRTLFSGQSFAAFLFDMDGTILSSIVAAERVWAGWARRHGLDVDAFLPTIHGVRTVETIRNLALPDIDPEAEAAAITHAEMEDVDAIGAIAGAATFLATIPITRWAIVTSASRALAERRLQAAGLPMPMLMITAEDVVHGKPAPECYLLASERLGAPIEQCLIFEDAPAGITAAEAAGANVVVITATHRHPFTSSHPGVRDFEALAAIVGPGGALQILSED